MDCGVTKKLAGWNVHLDSGQVQVPSGSFACCMATCLTDRSDATNRARRAAAKAIGIFDAVENSNALAEVYVLMLQHSARAIGLDVAMSFPKISANVSRNEVPAQPFDAISARSALNLVTSNRLDEPSKLNVVASMMCEIVFGGVLPKTALYFSFGARGDNPDCPLYGEAAMGECLTSIHPAQIAPGMYKREAVGLAGFPNRSDVIAREMEIANTGGTLEVEGLSHSKLSSVGEAVLKPGINMLGHAIILTRDSGLAANNEFTVQVSAVAREGSTYGRSTRGILLRVPTYAAFTRELGMTRTTLERRVMTLFTDFDLHRMADLRLALPSSARGSSVASNADIRSRVPGFVAAVIQDSFERMAGNTSVILSQQNRKRSASVAQGGELTATGGSGNTGCTVNASVLFSTGVSQLAPAADVTNAESSRDDNGGD
jgi:hypothetical protein